MPTTDKDLENDLSLAVELARSTKAALAVSLVTFARIFGIPRVDVLSSVRHAESEFDEARRAVFEALVSKEKTL